MEDYLIRDYNVFEDRACLKIEAGINEYFEDMGYELFDCGQGYYEEQIVRICKVGEKFFLVTISAEIGSQKQDRGDRLYFVDRINSVKYTPINKPLPKGRTKVVYKLNITDEEQDQLDKLIKELGIPNA